MSANWLLLLGFITGTAGGCGFGDNGTLVPTPVHACGDGIVDIGEGCDDGNLASGDGCSDACAVEVANPVCGNAVLEVGELCDDGNVTPGDGCSATCTAESVCGNSAVEPGEDCDDGNLTSGDGCSPTCLIEPATACMLVPQRGCSGTTPACDLDDEGGTECRAVTTQGNSDSHCADSTECRKGFTCISDGGVEEAWCARFCLTDSECVGTGSRCLLGLQDHEGDPLNIEVCTNACSPVAQTGCPSGMGCIARNATAGDFTDCFYMGTTLDGEVCTTASDCLPGSDCIDTGGTLTCEAYCVVGDDTTCPGSEICVPFTDELSLGTTELGSCD